LYPENDQDSTCHADCQSEDIDKRKSFVAKKVSVSDFEEVLNHVPGINYK
jgi:hypothetical protein